MAGNNPQEHSVVPFNPYSSLVAVCKDRETEAQEEQRAEISALVF